MNAVLKQDVHVENEPTRKEERVNPPRPMASAAWDLEGERIEYWEIPVAEGSPGASEAGECDWEF